RRRDQGRHPEDGSPLLPPGQQDRRDAAAVGGRGGGVPAMTGRTGRAPLAALLAAAAAGPLMAAAPPPVPSPGAASGFRVPAPVRTVLKNGLTVLVVERHTIPLVQMQLMVKSGSTSDPAGKEGTASLTARLLKRGTKSRPAAQFFEEVEFVG